MGARSGMGWRAHGPATPWELSPCDDTQPPSPVNVTRSLVLRSVEVE